MTTFAVPGPAHRLWTTRHEPVLEVEDGDVLTFDPEEVVDAPNRVVSAYLPLSVLTP